MIQEKQSEFLKKIETYWLVEARDLDVGPDLLESLRNPLAKITVTEFKWYLADAILSKRYLAQEYERLTGADTNTPEDVAADLSELWRLVFQDEPIVMPAQAS